MKNLDHHGVALAIALSSLAGFVDAVGFLQLGGFFVSFMSGNSTRLGVALGTGAWSHAGLAAGLIALFVTGVAAGTLVARRAPAPRIAVLALETVLLALAAVSHNLNLTGLGVGCSVLAMGAENAIFEREGGVGLTYMTGALVKVGQRIVAHALGEPTDGWARPLALWAGLTGGAVLGALAFGAFGLGGLWFAAAWAGLLTIAVSVRR